MKLYFVRHGASEANLLHEFSNRGHKHGLTTNGKAQAATLAHLLRGVGVTATVNWRPRRACRASTTDGRESRLARDEHQRGIVIEALPCPLLIVTGTRDRAWLRERYNNLWLTADYLSVEGASHWGLVLQRRALSSMLPAVLRWIAQHT